MVNFHPVRASRQEADGLREGAVCPKDMIRINFRFFSQACFCFSSRIGAPKKYFNKPTFFLIAHARRTGFAISNKDFILTSVLWSLNNIMAIQCQKCHLSLLVVIVS